MTGGTGGNVVNALFANTIAQTAMSGDRLGLADILFRSMMAKQAPVSNGAGTAMRATPQPSATASSAAPPQGDGFPLSPYWRAQGMRPPGGAPSGSPVRPAGGTTAGFVTNPGTRPAVPGGMAVAAPGAPPHTCPLPVAGTTAPIADTPPPRAGASPAAGTDPSEPGPEPKTAIAAFARRIGPVLQRAAAQLGVSPRILLAQAALESGWGRSLVGNNVFGLKAGPSWQRARIATLTHESENGRPVAQRAFFRAYGNLDEAVEDYVSLIADSPRYRAALGLGDDARGYGEALMRGGYATDGDYAQKLAAVAASPALAAALAELNRGEPNPAAAAG